MAVEQTLILAKPDAVRRSLAGEIVARFERRGLQLLAGRFVRASRELGEAHYAEHDGKPFFPSLVEFMTSGPIAPMVLEGDDAIAKVRGIMGATDPAKAAAGTIRKDFASSIEANAVHGSDSPQSAAFEIPYFFGAMEIFSR